MLSPFRMVSVATSFYQTSANHVFFCPLFNFAKLILPYRCSGSSGRSRFHEATNLLRHTSLHIVGDVRIGVQSDPDAVSPPPEDAIRFSKRGYRKDGALPVLRITQNRKIPANSPDLPTAHGDCPAKTPPKSALPTCGFWGRFCPWFYWFSTGIFLEFH